MVSVVINRYWLSSFHQGCLQEESDRCRETREVSFPEHTSPPDSPLWLRNSLLSLKTLLNVNSGLGCLYSAFFSFALLLLFYFFFFSIQTCILQGMTFSGLLPSFRKAFPHNKNIICLITFGIHFLEYQESLIYHQLLND